MLHPKGQASVRLSRNALNENGVKLASEVAYKEIIAVELAYDNEAFLLGEVLSDNGPRVVTSAFQSDMGEFKAGDRVLDICKLEPVSLGSSHYEYTDKTFPIFIEDIRKRKMQLHLTVADLSRRSARVAENRGAVKQQFVLSSEGKLAVLKLISAEEAVYDRRDLEALSGVVGD